jgi:hypothetical protein
MKRRAALHLIAAGVVAEPSALSQHHRSTAAPAPTGGKLQFFTPAQDALLDRLTEMIIPADNHSPGAHEARVSRFIDNIVGHSAKEIQEQWTAGLELVDDEARRRFDKPFLQCHPPQQDEILTAMAAAEPEPKMPVEHFFARLKLMTVDGYYTSAIGIHRELQYKGNAVLTEFPGCSHPEHK